MDPDRLLRSVGLDSAIFRHADGFIQSSQFARLLEECAHTTGDDCFGLHLGERFNPKNIGPLIYVVLNSPTIAAGFENAARYMKILNEAARVSLRVDGDHAYLEHALADMGIPSTRQNEEYGMTVSLNAIRLIAGSDWSPQEVRFAHELPNQTAEHLRIFRAPAVFGCETNALVTPREFVDRQVPAADQRLYRILKRYIDQHSVRDAPRRQFPRINSKGHRRGAERSGSKTSASGGQISSRHAHLTKTIEGIWSRIQEGSRRHAPQTCIEISYGSQTHAYRSCISARLLRCQRVQPGFSALDPLNPHGIPTQKRGLSSIACSLVTAREPLWRGSFPVLSRRAVFERAARRSSAKKPHSILAAFSKM